MAIHTGKLPSRQPVVSTPVEKAKVEAPKPATVTPSESFTATGATTGQKLVADGARADAVHPPAKNLGWDTGGSPNLVAVDRTLALLQQGKTGDASKVALQLANDLNAFLKDKPLLGATETPVMKQLAAALSAALPKALEAEATAAAVAVFELKSQGFTPTTMEALGAYNDRMLAQNLAEKADQLGKPMFADYFGKTMVMQPGTEATREERAKVARDALDTVPPAASGYLRNVQQQVARRVEITEAQALPVRSNEEITQASVTTGVANGYPADGLAAQIGGALQGLANHAEITQFAGHLLDLSLQTDDVKAVADPKARLDAGLQRAQYWVNNFGRNERELDPVWYGALTQHAAELADG